MNTYKCSNGELVTQGQIEHRMNKAKSKVLQHQRDMHGYNFCTTCKRNDCKPIDCAHIVSIDKAKKMGQTELCWSVSNIIPEGRGCHEKRDKLKAQWTQ